MRRVRIFVLIAMSFVVALLPSKVRSTSLSSSHVDAEIDPSEFVLENIQDEQRTDKAVIDRLRFEVEILRRGIEFNQRQRDQLIKELERLKPPFPGKEYEPPWIY